MKTFKLLFLIFFFIGCKKDPVTIDEVPIQMVPTNTCPSIYNTFLGVLPSGQNNKIVQPVFFNDTVLKNIVIKNETEVYLTIINENANANNSIGWYSYKNADLPLTKSKIKMHVLFPNASFIGSGGLLSTGNMMQLDTMKFAVGTVIGFYLVVNGWHNSNVDYSQPVLYTDYTLNNNQDQQHVLYTDTACKVTILSWEDTPLFMNSDEDYNDIVFTVSDNKLGLQPTSFDLKGIVVR